MGSLIVSQQVRLGKLLRTLIEYRTDLAVVPIGQKVRVHYKKTWRVLEEHPILSSEGLRMAIRGSFGEEVSRSLDQNGKAFFELKGQSFLLRFLKDHTGGLLAIERLKALPEPDRWPHAVHNWLENGGYLELEAEELYAALLKTWVQEKSGLVVSLERTIKYPLQSGKAQLEQREWKKDFETLEQGINEALNLSISLLAINSITLSAEEKEKLKNLARTIPILHCENKELFF